jgi:plastocyanin
MRWLVLAALVVGCGAPAPTTTPPPGAVVIVAQGTAFTTQNVTAPANAAFTLWFNNRDSELHNVQIWDFDMTVFTGQTFTGPAAKSEQVQALAPGTYKFTCLIHPQMTGELVAQ